jgi:hypothetical protein
MDQNHNLMPARSLCIHGHFYQPPRADPITGLIPNEVGAAPYRNWNERIFMECYQPNADLANFERMSFNIGPTLFEWMADSHAETCKKIVAQDRANVQRFGVGNAMAQAYNHTILPLAPYADKVTQVAWGIADFTHHFGRKPQGMWLPETAVDIETLRVLVDYGIEFTILAPWQANTNSLDPTEAYRVPLPEGRSIIVFFYSQELSSRVSFDPGSTSNADSFIQNIVIPNYNEAKISRGEAQLLMIASDGELYGHHQIFRDRFLAHMLNGASTSAGLSPTFPALWLKDNPVMRTVSIREKTSWSCHHGVLRWSGECGCTPGDGVWKSYFRRAFDRLAAAIDRVYEEALSPYIRDPWGLRNRYIHVMLGEISAVELINESAGRSLPADALYRIQWLLEAQRERQRMFTSCGWYFEDFGRIEPKNNVAYAAQAVRLTRIATGVDLAPQAFTDLKHIISHRTGLRGDSMFRKQMQRVEETTIRLRFH